MEKSLDLKMPLVFELDREEMNRVNGGGFFLDVAFKTFPVATTMVLTALAVDAEVIEGIEQGWTENKKN